MCIKREEDFELKLKRYFCENGEPTCAIDVPGGKACTFLGTKSFGTKELCMFPSLNGKKLDRRVDKDGKELGLLIPANGCPLFNMV